MVPRWTLPILLSAQLFANAASAGIRWEFDGTATPTGGDVVLLSSKPAFVSTATGNGLAPDTTLMWADAPQLRLRSEMEIACRFRLDELRDGVQILAMKDGEYILRVDWQKEGGTLSFFVQIEGKWEPRLRGPVVKTNTWYDVHAVWSGQTLKMDVNGETFSSARSGRTNPGAESLQFGPIAGVVDLLEIRNPSLERADLLAQMPADNAERMPKQGLLPTLWRGLSTNNRTERVPAKRTTFGGRVGWRGWTGQMGAICDVRKGVLSAAFPSPSAMLVSPPLACDLAPLPFICVEFGSVGPGWTGHIDIVTDAGTGSLSFAPQTGGRPALIPGTLSDAWTGTLRRMALSFSGGEGPITIRQLALADRPIGTPSFYIRSLAAGRAKLRPGREETIVVGIQNVGGEAEDITARLSVPGGIRILDKAKRAIPYLGMDDFDMATWRIKITRPGTFTARVAVSAKGVERLTSSLALMVEPLPDLPPADYVPKPLPAQTDYINLMHYCALWKEGTHYGWKRIEPWPSHRPAIGWYDEGTPEVADWHIKYALEHGINGFIYCWYRAHYEPEIEHKLGHAIHDGLFNAKYRDMFNFTIMWENGCAKGVKDEDDLLENLLPFWIENYFTHPSYLKIDNQPVLIVWQPRRLIPQLGGPDGTRRAFGKMRAQCRDAGFDGLRIIACMNGPDDTLGRQIAEGGWDAVTGYNLSPAGVKTAGLDPAGLAYRDHADVLSRYKQTWIDRDACTGVLPDIPNVVMGRDDRPWGRIKRGKGVYIAAPEAENFEAACRDAKELVDAKPRDRWDSKIVVFDNWTEFGEGHYIEPTTGTGFTFVNAIKRVFCTGWAPEAVTDIIPEDLGMPPPQKRYEEVRAGYGDRMPWQPVRITGDLIARWEFETREDGGLPDSSVNDCRLSCVGLELEPGRGGNVLRCGNGGATAPAPPPFFHPGGVTVAVWCKPSEADQSDRWMLNTTGGTNGYRLGFGGGHPVWQVPRERWSHGLQGPEPLPVGEWSHVAATFDNRIMRLYVNGTEVSTLERRGFINPGDGITVGGHSADMDRARFRGCLDSVRVYRRVLPPAEIAGLAK
ncbi:MAG: hypothetical protein HN742_12730 [Lentisphaerae bacterium]|nr:hypothetical protein [Lentisphaerota bacterium]MBT4815842.1 hypothetical protein [Lentisphaerota bacterium]MBT5607378.1 hypothetical protein [Lentisphaerota bacterium]MBT7057816.1 hypothetical protein [Lentisphaerota bacterium]MBT7842734.1 hypothetical protein [Lentisphaerota bacterium]